MAVFVRVTENGTHWIYSMVLGVDIESSFFPGKAVRRFWEHEMTNCCLSKRITK
jgi:hypothetical protein